MSRKRDIVSAKPVFVDERREAHRRVACAVSNLERAIANLVLSPEEGSVFERVLEANRATELKLREELKADGKRPKSSVVLAKHVKRTKPKASKARSRKPSLTPDDYRELSRDIRERNRAGIVEDSKNNLPGPILDVIPDNSRVGTPTFDRSTRYSPWGGTKYGVNLTREKSRGSK
jgi:hypothetical protein